MANAVRLSSAPLWTGRLGAFLPQRLSFTLLIIRIQYTIEWLHQGDLWILHWNIVSFFISPGVLVGLHLCDNKPQKPTPVMSNALDISETVAMWDRLFITTSKWPTRQLCFLNLFLNEWNYSTKNWFLKFTFVENLSALGEILSLIRLDQITR